MGEFRAESSSLAQPSETTRWRRDVLLAALAATPFLLPYVRHYCCGIGLPTGFIQWDMPYYLANGRAIFERGNGLAYPNPYDPNPQAPAIYFHWLVWLLGFGTAKLHADPGYLLTGLELVSSVACAWVTLKIVDAVRVRSEYRVLLYLLTMWGGGLLCLGRIGVNLAEGRAWHDQLLLYDPCDGWWFLNWGRNLVLPTEATYHTLVALSWLAILRGRPVGALVAASAAAATHPFTGLQALLILAAAWGLELLVRPSWRQLWNCFAVGVALLAFAAYYGVYLETFPQHRALRSLWSLEWVLSPSTIVLAYGPVALLAAVGLWQRWRWQRDTRFWLCAFGVSFLLANHQWFVPARQPLHFTRGYIWMPLWLLGFPWLQGSLVRLRECLRKPALVAVLVLFSALMCSDNALFVGRSWVHPRTGFFLTPGSRALLRWVERHNLRGEVLCSDPVLNYLASAYTGLRPYYGHMFNTPNYVQREQEAKAFFMSEQTPRWLGEIEYLVVPSINTQWALDRLAAVDWRPWQVIYANDEDTLLSVHPLEEGRASVRAAR